MTLNGKNMNEWLLEQVNKKEEVIHEKDESIVWIKWAVFVSIVVILVGFYFLSKPTNSTTKSSTSSVASVSSLGNSAPINFESVLENQSSDSRYSHVWGKENIKITPQHEFKVFFPKWSYSPSSVPKGGAGFIYKLDYAYESAKLSYKVKFEQGFDFVKWGKLPGFCSLDCPRGGSDVGPGFSTRFMWRNGGDIEGYLYIPGKEGAYGKSFGRGSFRFEPGKYYKIEQFLKMNTPGKNDGILVIYADEKEVFRDEKVKFREGPETKIDSILFSTFFGGSDGSFATPKDTYAYFKDFAVSH